MTKISLYVKQTFVNRLWERQPAGGSRGLNCFRRRILLWGIWPTLSAWQLTDPVRGGLARASMTLLNTCANSALRVMRSMTFVSADARSAAGRYLGSGLTEQKAVHSAPVGHAATNSSSPTAMTTGSTARPEPGSASG